MKKESYNYLSLKVKVKPGSKETKLERFVDNLLTLRIKAQPEKGKANQELIRYLSRVLQLPEELITIAHGHTSQYKLLKLPPQALKRLKELVLLAEQWPLPEGLTDSFRG